jgi:hypothetical protein
MSRSGRAQDFIPLLRAPPASPAPRSSQCSLTRRPPAAAWSRNCGCRFRVGVCALHERESKLSSGSSSCARNPLAAAAHRTGSSSIFPPTTSRGVGPPSPLRDHRTATWIDHVVDRRPFRDNACSRAIHVEHDHRGTRRLRCGGAALSDRRRHYRREAMWCRSWMRALCRHPRAPESPDADADEQHRE